MIFTLALAIADAYGSRYIEGVKELTDTPGEWWYDDRSHELYYYFNSSSEVSTTVFVASKLATLFR